MDSDSAEMVNEVQNKVILHWNFRGLVELPEIIRFHGNHIQEIYLKWNKLTTLPPWIIELLNVTNLYIYGNMIKELPQEIGDMRQLMVLDLSANKLEEVPSSLGNLVNLKSLLLNSNFITSLPSEMNILHNLEVLSIADNKLIALPEWVGSLPRLKELNVDNNLLKELPNRLTTSPKLSIISVCSNRLRFLPMNGFVSSINICFEGNVHLNYLSYPLILQQIAQHNNLFALRRKTTLGYRCIEENEESSTLNRNIRLSIRRNHVHELSDQIIELPRQLLNAYKVHNSVVVSLWELSLRKIYTERYEHTLDISTSPLTVSVRREPIVQDYKFEQLMHCMNYASYNLLINGPASICVNYQCQQPIFTEAWVVTGVLCHTDCLTTVALCCCRRCALEFVTHFTKMIILDWEFVE